MSQHARIEEVSDSDSDPSEMDVDDFDPAQIIAPARRAPAAASSSLMDPTNIPATSDHMLQPQFQAPTHTYTQDREKSKHWQCVYPIYFDSNRSRAEGRRVGKEQAVANPLAREIVDAVQQLGLNVVFEPGKTHPKDWSNPGRVRILLKEDGKQVARNVKNKHHLYTLISAYLKAHPTTTAHPLRLRIAGLPMPKEPPPPPAVPRGWKMNTILPLHSPAMSGGGVSDNLFKDMMAEMSGEGSGTPAGGSGSEKEGKKSKKDKKKVKA